MSLHIHWRRPAGPVRGPFMLTPHGAIGIRTYVCRCGQSWERDEAERRPTWRSLNDDPPAATQLPVVPSGPAPGADTRFYGEDYDG